MQSGLAATIQQKLSSQVRDASVMVLQPPADPGPELDGRFRADGRGPRGQGDRHAPAGRSTGSWTRPGNGPSWPASSRPSRPGCPSSSSTSTGPRPAASTCRSPTYSPCSRPTSAVTTSTTSTSTARSGRSWSRPRGASASKPEDIQNLYVLNRKGERVHLSSLGEVRYALGPIDVPHYNLYGSAKINGGPAPGYSSGQALAAMEEIAATVLPEGFGFEWTGTTFQEQKTGNQATYIFALSVVCVFLFMAALYESWIRPMVIILTVPLAMFGAVVGLWLYDMPLDVFGQIGLVMLIGLETKNAILIVEFGVEMRKKHGMSILESAKAASRERLRPILMTSFAFVMGVLPMARATGAGAYSRNSLGIVIAFGIAVSTVLGRFVIPIYYVLGERLIDFFARLGRGEGETDTIAGDHRPDDEDAPGLREDAIPWPGRGRRGIPVPASAESSGALQRGGQGGW